MLSNPPSLPYNEEVTSIGIQVDKEVVKEKFDNFLGWVLREKGPNLYRSKGVIAIKAEHERDTETETEIESGRESLREREDTCTSLAGIAVLRHILRLAHEGFAHSDSPKWGPKITVFGEGVFSKESSSRKHSNV